MDEPLHNAQDSATGVKDSQSKTTGKIVDPPSNDCNNDSATPVIGNMSETTEGISTGEQKSRDTSGNETRVENAATGSTSPGEDQVKETDDEGKSSHPIEENSEAKSVGVQFLLEMQNDDKQTEKDDGGSEPGCGKVPEVDPNVRTNDPAPNEEDGQSYETPSCRKTSEDPTPSPVAIVTEGTASEHASGNKLINERGHSKPTSIAHERSQNPEKTEDNSKSSSDSSSSPDAIPEEPSDLKPPIEVVSTDSDDDPYASIYQRKLSCSVAEAFRDKSELYKSGHPSIYYLKPSEKISDSQPLRWFTIGKRNGDVKHKTILLVGATGSGKSTLVDAMVNYVLGVKWEDDFRFKIVPDEGNGNQAQSQTTFITSYTIHHTEGMAVPYSLTIIDTPGFGDTGGVKRDEEITRLIGQFLTNEESSIHEINAICLVATSASARLTPTQNYIISSVLSLFGKDVMDHIRLLATFCDGAFPPVVEACHQAGFPLKRNHSTGHLSGYCKFNNSVLYVNNETGGLDEVFWSMADQSFKEFFSMLGHLSPKSLLQTKKVAQSRLGQDDKMNEIDQLLDQWLTDPQGNRGKIEMEIIQLLENLAAATREIKNTAVRSNMSSVRDFVDFIRNRLESDRPDAYQNKIIALERCYDIWNARNGGARTVTTLDDDDDEEEEMQPKSCCYETCNCVCCCEGWWDWLCQCFGIDTHQPVPHRDNWQC